MTNLNDSRDDWAKIHELGPSDCPLLFDRITGDGPFICTGEGPDAHGRWRYYGGTHAAGSEIHQGACWKWPQALSPQRLVRVVAESELTTATKRVWDLQHVNGKLRRESEKVLSNLRGTLAVAGTIFGVIVMAFIAG